MEYDDFTESCFICNGSSEAEDAEQYVVKIKRGLDALKSASVERNDGFIEFLTSVESVSVHGKCSSKYMDERYIHAEAAQNKRDEQPLTSFSPTRKKLRTSLIPFDWKTKCFICGNVADGRKEKRKSKGKYCQAIRNVYSTTLREIIFKKISECRDDCSRSIYDRIVAVSDLVAVGAKYHRKCHDFVTYHYPKKTETVVAVGAPKKTEINDAMQKIYNHMEKNDDGLFTFVDLKSCLNDSDYVPEDSTILTRLQKHFPDNVTATSKSGCSTIICFKDCEYDILLKSRDEHLIPNDKDEQHLWILMDAADLIRSDIRSKVHEHILDNNMDSSIPQILKMFLRDLNVKKMTISADKTKVMYNFISQSIVKVLGTRSAVPSASEQ